MRGRAYANGICRGCGHRWYAHGYIGLVHTCAGCRAEGRPECERYVRDRRERAPR